MKERNKPQPGFCALNLGLGAMMGTSRKPASLFELSTVCLCKTKGNFTLSSTFNVFSPLIGLNKPPSSPSSYQEGSCLRGHHPWPGNTQCPLALTVKSAYIHTQTCLWTLESTMDSCRLGVAWLEVGDSAKCLRLTMTGCIEM